MYSFIGLIFEFWYSEFSTTCILKLEKGNMALEVHYEITRILLSSGRNGTILFCCYNKYSEDIRIN